MRKIERPHSPFDHPLTKGGPGSGHHGHDGRPGERGGSLPREGEVRPSHTTISPEIRASLADDARVSLKAALEAQKWTPELLRNQFDSNLTGPQLNGVNKDLRNGFEATMVMKGLATQEELENLRRIRSDWNGSSDAISSDALEYIISDETGGSVWTTRGKDYNYSSKSRDVTKDADFRAYTFKGLEGQYPGMTEERLRFLVSHESVYQQSILRELYGDEITIFRGVRGVPDSPTGQTYLRTNGISSWTRDVNTAKGFSNGESGAFRVKVPVERVFSSGLGGFGTMYESEVVLKGGVYRAADVFYHPHLEKADETKPLPTFDVDEEWENRHWIRQETNKGGAGSGHHGHAGVPGQRGGSAPGTLNPRSVTGKELKGFPPATSKREGAGTPVDHSKYEKKLTPAEKAALDFYCNQGSEIVNNALRHGKPIPEYANGADKHLKTALEKADDTERLVYRGARIQEMEPEIYAAQRRALVEKFEKSIGKTVRMTGYQSTSTSPDIAAKFAGVNDNPVFEIRARGGAPIGKMFGKGESEVILPHNAKYRVLDVVHNVRFRNPQYPNRTRFTVIRLEML